MEVCETSREFQGRLLHNTEFLHHSNLIFHLPSVCNNNGCAAGHPSNCEIRTVIKFLKTQNMSGAEILENCVMFTVPNTHYEPRSSHLSDGVNDKTSACTLINAYHCFTVFDIF